MQIGPYAMRCMIRIENYRGGAVGEKFLEKNSVCILCLCFAVYSNLHSQVPISMNHNP